jgi:hypothetical protein
MKITKLKATIILISLVCFLVLATIIGSVICAVEHIEWPLETMEGIIIALIGIVSPLCSKILEKHNEPTETTKEKTLI